MSATIEARAVGRDASGNIYAALHAVYQQVGYVRKQAPKAGSGLNYTYASEKAFIEALRPAMIDAGIVVHVLTVSTDLRDSYTNKQGTVMNRTCITATVRFAHAASGTYVDVQAIGEGIDAGDKSAPKAMTGAYKYALRETFCIETGDDPDDADDVQAAAPQRKTREKKQDTPEAAARRKLWAVAQEKGMDQAALYAYFGTDSLKSLAEHMKSGAKDCGCQKPHNFKDLAAGYRWMADLLGNTQ